MDTSTDAYWKANIRLVSGCLIVWFIVAAIVARNTAPPPPHIQQMVDDTRVPN